MMDQIIARFPGVSCAWTDADGCVTSECYGMADRERGIPVDENTIFPACSIAKFITALCLMKLQEQGAIDIDMPVNDYLHQWKLRTQDGNESNATIRALMCHTLVSLTAKTPFMVCAGATRTSACWIFWKVGLPTTTALRGRKRNPARPLRIPMRGIAYSSC